MRRRGVWLGALSLVAVMLLTGPAGAEPSLKSVALRAMGSLRIQPYRWMTVDAVLTNPDETATSVRLRLSPQNQRNVTVYEIDVPLPPRTRFHYTAMVTAGRTESYDVQLFHRGALIDTDKGIPVRVGQEGSSLTIVNDDPEIAVGDFVRNKKLRATQQVSSLRTTDLYAHWAGYDQCDLLVLAKPDLTRLTALQAEALLGWIARGGTVFFCTPDAILAAAATPLAACLPVRPVRYRETQNVQAFADLGGGPVVWPESTPFLDSVPEGPGITVLTHEEAPLLRWRRYGLGLVGVITADVANNHFKEAGDGEPFAALWNHVLSHGGRLRFASSPTPGQPRAALESITGIEIPARSAIRTLVIGYLVLLLVLIGGGMLLRRWLVAWGVTGVLAVVFTAGIFVYAHRRTSSLPAQTAALVSYQTLGTADATNERIVSLYKRGSEARVALAVPRVDHRLRAAAPDMAKPRPDSTRAPRRQSDAAAEDSAEAVRDPLRLSYQGDIVACTMLLRANAPQMYAQLSKAPHAPAPSLPTVHWTADGPTIDAWTVPPELAATAGALVGPNGVWPVTVNRGTLSLKPSHNAQWLPEEDLGAMVAFLTDSRSPTPLLALYSRELAADRTGVPDGFVTIARSLTLLPVRQDLTAAITLPPQMLPVEVSSAGARLMRQYGVWQSLTEQADKTYELEFTLPPGCKRLQADEIRIDFDADNRGRNLLFEVSLRAADGGDLLATDKDGTTWTFAKLPPDLLDPADGRGTILVQVVPQVRVASTAATRMNTWTVRRLDVTVRGKLPERNQGAF